MKRKHLLIGAGMLALLLALVASTTVFAEGETPPLEPEASPVDQEPLPEEPAVVEEAPVDEPPLVEELPVVELPEEELIFDEEPPAAGIAPVEVETSLAEEDEALAAPDLVLADGNGVPLDLVRQESAETLAAPDPYFIAGGITYRFLPSGQCTIKGYWDLFGVDIVPNNKCFESTTPIQAAINYVGAYGIVPADKKIYVEGGTYIYNENVTIDGNDPTLSALPGMTYGTYLKQLNGLIGISLPTTPIINGNVGIFNVIAGFTLSNFEINGEVNFSGNTGLVKVVDVKVKNTNGVGVFVGDQKGAVELINVRSDGNKYHGAYLGAGGTGAYTVKITNSTFNDNASTGIYAGLWIQDFTGAITIDSISANRNYGYGVHILGSPSSVTIRNSVFNDNTHSTLNYGYGLKIDLTGPKAVTLENISAMRNARCYGIYIQTLGAVMVKNTRAEGNRIAGMRISNYGGGPVPVTVINGVFSNNTEFGSEGLNIFSYGTVTLTSVRAEYNGGRGVYIDNCIDSGGVCLGSGAVIINSPAAGGEAAVNVFSHNNFFGLEVQSRGSISLFNFLADENNMFDGISIRNDFSNSIAGVTVGASIPNDLQGMMWFNSAYHNYLNGLDIISNGTVSVSRLNASANRLNNIEIANWDVPDAAPKAVTLSYIHTNGYYGSAEYSQSGLVVNTKGNVSITNIQADQHNNDGVFINTCQYNGGLDKCLGSGSVTVTSIGTPNSFSQNGYTGMRVLARGAITLKNFLALSNGWSSSYQGIYLKNNYPNSSGAITLDATLPQPFMNEAGGNSDYGIQVYSKGAITLGRTLVQNNGNNGVVLGNRLASSDQPVTVRFSVFRNNKDFGLYVFSKGQITLTNVVSENNTGNSYGAMLNNADGLGGVTVNTSGVFTNQFNNHLYNGLDITSRGAVLISNTQAHGNGSNNIYIENHNAPSAKAVTMINVSVNGLDPMLGTRKSNYGMSINTRGAVSLTGVNAAQHKQNGIYVQIYTLQSAVTLTNSSSSSNGGYGIYIYGLGQVTLNNTSADDSGSSGVYINNCQINAGYCTGTGGVSVIAPTGKYASFSRNVGSGLTIYSGGAVILTNVRAEENGSHGVSVYQLYNKLVSGLPVAQSGNVTVSGIGAPSMFNSNLNRGLYIQSYGNVSVTNAEIRHNHNDGLVVNNSGASAAPTVSLTDINANYNWDYSGISVQSKGAVTLKGLDVSDNNVLVGQIWNGLRVVDHLSHTAGEDQWWFNTTEPYSVFAVLNSTRFDAYLCLYQADGSLITCDDNNGGGTNALINNYGLTAPGDYYLAVRAKDGSAGGYDLTLGTLSSTDFFYVTGLSIDNSYSETNAPVTITPSGRGYGVKANDNSESGVYIYSDGLVSITKSWANFNRYKGFDINNQNSGVETGVTLKNVYADDNHESSGRGLYLTSKGNIIWVIGSASRNGFGGAEINNTGSTKNASVTVSGVITNENRDWPAGLTINSKGVVNLTNLVANRNGIGSTGSGVYVNNCQDAGGTCTKNANVTLSGNTNLFNENTGTGIYIYSGGLVMLSNFNTSGNFQSGVRINNSYSDSLGIVIKRSISGMNEVTGNGQYGLYVNSKGAVWVEKVKAAESGFNNIYIYNAIPGAPKTVTVKSARVENSRNTHEGLYIETSGAVLLDGVKAIGNSYHGARIVNSASTTPASITVLRSLFDSNGGRGLAIEASGDITLGGVVARYNFWDGVRATTNAGKVTVSAAYGDNVFSYNGTGGIGAGSGLTLWEVYGSISLARVIANDNSASGLSLDNDLTTNPGGTVTISNVTLTNNLIYGLSLITRGGAVTISGATVLDNGREGDYDGIYIEGHGALQPVTLVNSRLMGNFGYGLNCQNMGALTLTGVVNIGNDANGNISGEDNLYIWP